MASSVVGQVLHRPTLPLGGCLHNCTWNEGWQESIHSRRHIEKDQHANRRSTIACMSNWLLIFFSLGIYSQNWILDFLRLAFLWMQRYSVTILFVVSS